MLGAATDASANSPVPSCIICERTHRVRSLVPHPDGVQYWTCDDCLVSWATHEPAPAADMGPRLFWY